MGGFGSGRRRSSAGAVPTSLAGAFPSGGARVAPLEMSPIQRYATQVRRSETKPRILFGGAARGGKSKWMARDALIAGAVDYPGDNFIFARKSLKDLRPQLWEDFKELLVRCVPEQHRWFVDNPAPRAWIRVKKPNGEIVITKYFCFDAKDYNKIMGFAVRGFYIDEANEVGSDWVDKMGSRFSHGVGESAYHFMVYAANPHPGWLKRAFKPVKDTIVSADKNHIFIPARVKDNPFLGEGVEDAMGATMSEAERRRYIDGDWDSFKGAVYSMFDEEKHVWRFNMLKMQKARAFSYCQPMDWGYRNPLCLLFMARDAAGRHFAYDEIYGEGISVSRLASAYFKKCDYWKIPESERIIPVDQAADQVERDGSSPFREMLECGLPAVLASNRARGTNHIQRYLELMRTFIHPRCSNLIVEVPEYIWDEHSQTLAVRRDAPERPRKLNDHACDAWRYGHNYFNEMLTEADAALDPLGPAAQIQRVMEQVRPANAPPSSGKALWSDDPAGDGWAADEALVGAAGSGGGYW